jgi:hypothetical protein
MRRKIFGLIIRDVFLVSRMNALKEKKNVYVKLKYVYIYIYLKAEGAKTEIPNSELSLLWIVCFAKSMQ